MWTKVKRYFKYLLTPEPNPRKWLFIAGCPNSGTSLLHDLLANHPSIGSMPQEGQFLTDQLIRPYQLGLSRLWMKDKEKFVLNEHSVTKTDIKRLKKQWALQYNDTNKEVLIEKSPTNAVRTRWLQKHFTPSFFIGIYRNGYAVSKGISDKTGADIRTCAMQWIESNEIMMDDFSSLQHKLLISYEDLTNDPVVTIRKITDFLSLPPMDNVFIYDYCYTINKKTGTIQNKNSQSISLLSTEEISGVNEVASLFLGRLNYKILPVHQP